MTAATDLSGGLPRARSARRDGAGRLTTAAIALVMVVVAVLGVVAWRASAQTAANRGSQSGAAASSLAGPAALAAQAAAITEVRATLTYSYAHLATDFAAAEKDLTPDFRATYVTTTAQQVTPLAKKYHAVSSAVVTDAGVSSSTPTAVTVLLFVDQTVHNTRLSAPRLDRSRIKAVMVKQNGRWLIEGLTPL
jgi:Mce-associated membrane protein